MSLIMAILMLAVMWISVAAAMLWGVLRIVRRHQPHHHAPPLAKRRERRQANAH